MAGAPQGHFSATQMCAQGFNFEFLSTQTQ
jgi:hypothetical protein